MFYWIISAALIASASASPYRNPPCNWAIMCSPSQINTVSGDDLITMNTYQTIPMPVSPVDNSKTEISTSTKTSSGNADFDSSQIKYFMDYFNHTVTTSVPPTTTITEAPKPQFSEAEMEMIFKSFTRYFKDYFFSAKAPSTTTTEATEPKTNQYRTIDTKILRGHTNSSGNADFDFSQIKDFMDYFSHTVTKPVPPTTTITEAPKPQFSEAEMEMIFKSFTRYFKDYFSSAKAPSTTTTEAPEPKTNQYRTIDTKILRGQTNSFENSQKISGKFAGEEKFDSMAWKKSFADHPELWEKYLAYRKDHTVSQPNFGPSFKKAPENPEPCDEETKQFALNNKDLISVFSPITTIAPAPASSQPTVIKTISGSQGVGRIKSTTSSIMQYISENKPTGYRMISGENLFKVPHTSSADLNQLTQIKKVPTFQQNPCEFSLTGTFRFIPCNNLMNQETVVQKTIPIINSAETYKFESPFEFSNANNGFEIKEAADY
ncbi:uncharacterized protein LOC123261467 [Cotesia glomerata]|uniref:uncharacterized protein LOC123261467 n=1 Tax=Cotesia glomerata TaxID=32391 RepID=UPI001D030129|nr:uncharacterized protein LOC123261467 [Cotesia glomerata]